jgi:hypothetical protein
MTQPEAVKVGQLEVRKFGRVLVQRETRPDLTVHRPAGTRIELGMEQAVELLRALPWGLSCSGTPIRKVVH